MTVKVNLGRKLVILLVIFCVLAMVAASFIYRANHPNLYVRVQSQSGPQFEDHDHDGDGVQEHGSEGGMSAPPGMGRGMSGPMGRVREFMVATEANPDDVEALIGLGNSFLMMRAWDRALKPLTRANALAPGNIELLKAIGVAYFNKKEFDKASAVYEEILTIAPNDSLALFNLGVINKHYLGKPDVAETCFRKVLEVEKENRQIIEMVQQELGS